MRTTGSMLMLMAALTTSTLTFAAPPPWSNSRHHRDYSEGYDYAPVTRVEPIVRQVRVETPRRECWEEPQYVESHHPSVGARTVLGGVIGGVIGHQIGSGRGKDAATIAGAVIGSTIGYSTAPRSAPEERLIQRCETRYERGYEERVEGYRVTYRYNGREYSTRLPYDPGERIRIHMSVAAAE